jgi:hypothetical protein
LSKSKLPVRQEGHSGFGQCNTARGVVKANQAAKNNFHSAAKRTTRLVTSQQLDARTENSIREEGAAATGVHR